MNTSDGLEPIAVVGLAVRVAGADTAEEFWANLRAGRDCVTRFTEAELRAEGVDPLLLEDPDFVPASAVIDGADAFDASFFGFSPREAEMLDPQHRLFLECAWAALEDAGHDPAGFPGAIGVYAGCFMNKYLPVNLLTNPAFVRSPGAYLARNYNDKDFLAGRAAYLFDLTGPAITVQTACSTSLVATHLACQALLSYDCDLAVVGGVSLHVPLRTGYLAVDGGLLTPEGHCRPFDARAQGTVPGFGATLVLLRRLGDALTDRDHVRAVIRGTAINNDGNRKVSFTAPSIDRQVAVITAAQAVADVTADTIGYVEAHGTGTPLGDPIEVAALTEAFRRHTDQIGQCALGSVKANIGHLDAGAGTAGLIRAVLALEHAEIPPHANFEVPNPQLKLDDSPFYVPTAPTAWPAGATPRRAGVSSFGVGGTNAHAVLEEAPTRTPGGPARRWQLLPVSARDRTALDEASGRLADHLHDRPDAARLTDVAFTLQRGRRHFPHRRFVVADGPAEAAARLRERGRSTVVEAGAREVVFMFPGGGSQHPDMAAEIYAAEPVFAAEVDHCADLLRARLGYDVRAALFPSRFPTPSGLALDRPADVLAAIVVTEYALARLWQSWGVSPAALVGHSLGEYVAACLAGVLTLPDALHIAVLRGELFARMPPGRMLSVSLPEAEVAALVGDRLSVAAINGPELTLVSGPRAAIEAVAAELAARDVECREVHIDVASHSFMVEPYLAEFTRAVGGYALAPPRLPVLSGVTGTWLTEQEATDPGYWARHLRRPVRFADCLRTAADAPGRVLLEVGPGQTLTRLAGAQRLVPPPPAVASLPHPGQPQPDLAHLIGAVGRLWQAGVSVDWEALHGPAEPVRVPLPTYPFQRRRYWIPPGRPSTSTGDFEVASADAEGDAGGTPLGPDLPVGDDEAWLADVWSELLGLNGIGRHDDFTTLGGHSLLAAQLVKRIRRARGVALRIGDIFARPTVADLAPLLTGDGAAAEPDVDLAAEAALDPAVVPSGRSRPPEESGSPATVLLTGATGFLGAYLCAELLASTQAEVVCLVRAADAEEGRRRVRDRLAEFGLDPGPAAGRLRAVPGDLSRPWLGLDRAAFDALAARVDAVYHCGAWVNFVRPYRALKPSNVLGTQEVLRLAAAGAATVHHVSTAAVHAGAIVAGVDVIAEDADLSPPVGHETAYSQSKWVAEQLVWQAARRGLPVAVYRPGVVLGDSRTGVSNREDYYTRVIQGCVRLGAAPLRRFAQPAAAVDVVARTIVSISRAPTAVGHAFHTVAARPLHWNEIFDHVRTMGYPVRSLPFEDWRRALAERLETADEEDLAPLADLIGAATADRAMPRFDTANVESVLGPDASSSTMDSSYFATVLRYFRRVGWLPASTGEGIPA